jgi:hypothetical protein
MDLLICENPCRGDRVGGPVVNRAFSASELFLQGLAAASSSEPAPLALTNSGRCSGWNKSQELLDCRPISEVLIQEAVGLNQAVLS